MKQQQPSAAGAPTSSGAGADRWATGQRRYAEQYSGVAILLLCLGLGAVLYFAGAEPYLPGPLWLLLLLVCVAGLFVAGDPGRPFRWQMGAYGLSVMSSWVLIGSLPLSNMGMLVVLMVVVAAVGSYVLPLWGAGVVILLNMAVVVGAFVIHQSSLVDAVVSSIFYTIIHVAAVLSTYALYRESLMRAELEEKNLELEAAGVLLEKSAATAERLRISRDLHDSVGHQLTVLNLELEALKHLIDRTQQRSLAAETLSAPSVPAQPEGPSSAPEVPDLRSHIDQAAAVAKGLLHDVRSTVGELRQTDTGDLQASLDRLSAAVPSLEIHVEVDSDVSVDDQEAGALVRAAQEIITNAVKHSEARELSLVVVQDGGQTVLTGTNDGLAPRSITFGHGLTGLRERIELLGGTVEVSSSPQFTVQVRLPGAGTRAAASRPVLPDRAPSAQGHPS